MKINSVHNLPTQSKKSSKSDIQFKSQLISSLPTKFENLGLKLQKYYNETRELNAFPCDTFMYREEESFIVSTPVMHNGKMKDIVTKKDLIYVDDKKDSSFMALVDMLLLNHQTAKINMV